MAAHPNPTSTSEAIDDYLKAILELGGAEDARVTTKSLAARLGVRTPSVTGMLQKLALRRPSLVLYEKHRGVRLTAAGKHRAWELVRHHRLLELFLHDVLKYSWDEVHDEAERLEHFISERFEDRVAAVLGDPRIDPHGHPIPPKNRAAGQPAGEPLSEWPVGKAAVIASVSDRNAADLRELERLGLIPGASLIIGPSRSNASIMVRLVANKQPIRLRSSLASRVLVIEGSVA